MKNTAIAALTILLCAAIYLIAVFITFLAMQSENLQHAHDAREHLKCIVRAAQNELAHTAGTVAALSADLESATGRVEQYAAQYRAKAAELSEIYQSAEFLKEALALGANGVTADLSDLRVPSGASEAQINTLLEGTPLYTLGWYFLAAEREYGVNAIIMISIMRQESGIATTGSLWRQNNFAGISNGRGGWARFETPQDGIFALARLLGVHYLCYEGRFHRGVSLDAVNVLYAPLSDPLNHGWAPGIRSHTAQFLERLENENDRKTCYGFRGIDGEAP